MIKNANLDEFFWQVFFYIVVMRVGLTILKFESDKVFVRWHQSSVFYFYPLILLNINWCRNPLTKTSITVTWALQRRLWTIQWNKYYIDVVGRIFITSC